MPEIEPEKKPSFFKTLLGKCCLIGLACVLVIGGFIWWFEARKYVWTNDAYIEAYNVQLSSDIDGRRITKLYVDEGDYVKTGEPILDLRKDILEAEKLEAETNISVLEEVIKQKKVFMEKLRDNYVIAKKEFENDIISFLNFDHKEKDYRMAQIEYEVAKRDFDNGIAKLGVVLAYLDHTTVYAPRDGMIAKRWILAGDVVHLGQPLFQLNELNNVWITAFLEETKLEHVKVGSPVKIHIDCYHDREFTGHVWVIKASAASKFALIPPNNATGNFTKVVQRIPVKIHLDIPKTKDPLYLFPGMSCEVKIRIRD